MRRLSIIILIIISTLGLHGQYTVDSAINFADQQYLRGNYYLALKEYQRISYNSNFQDAGLLFKMGNCFLNQGDWNNARNYYDQVIRITTDDELLLSAEIKNISTYIQEEAYKRALIDLYSVHDSVYQQFNQEINLLFAITNFGLEDFEASREYFKKVVADDSVACHTIDSLFSQKKMFNRPHPKLAYVMSLIIPGTGQLYSGDFAQGLNSMILNGGLLALGVYVTVELSLLDAVLSVIPWYQRYHMGGLENTTEIAERKRQERRSQVYRETMEVVRGSMED